MLPKEPSSVDVLETLCQPPLGVNETPSAFTDEQVDAMLGGSLHDRAAAMDDTVFDAPVNEIVNFPDFIAPWPTEMAGT